MNANNAARGIAFMCLAVGIFPFLNASVKILGESYSVQQVLWVRYLGHFVLMLVIFLPFYGGKVFRTKHLGAQLVRSLLLLGSTACYFTALNYLPLTTAASISFTSPFIVTALSVPLLGEKVGPRRWTAIGIGFIGALIIIRPGAAAFHGAELFVVASATFYSFYQIMTRRLAGRDSTATTILYTSVFGAILTTMVAPFYWQMPSAEVDWLLFAATGVFGGLGHLFVVKAFQWAEVSVISPFVYLQLVGAVILGFFIFGEFPDLWTWVGSAVIVSCGAYITYRETVLSHRAGT